MLKSELITQARANVTAAQDALEQSVRALVSTEQGSDDWVVGVPYGTSKRTVEVQGIAIQNEDLSAALNLTSLFDTVNAYEGVNDLSAWVKGLTQPVGFSVTTETYDEQTEQWAQDEPYTVQWTKLPNE